MTDKLKQLIKEELIKLPKELQNVINSFDWEKETKDIGQKFLLTEEELNGLYAEVAIILLNISDEELLQINIENRIGTTKKEALNLTQEIRKRILKPMGDKRNELFKNNLIFNKPNWKQSVNFIISGGDYSVFEKI